MYDFIIGSIYVLSSIIVWTQMIATIGVIVFRERVFALIYVEMLPFYWCGWMGYGIFQLHKTIEYLQEGSTLVAGFLLLVSALDFWLARIYYKLWRNSDDDRWKKRRKKAAEKIKNLGDRLVVVPATS